MVTNRSAGELFEREPVRVFDTARYVRNVRP